MFGLVPGRVELLFSEMGKALGVLGRMGCPVRAVGGFSPSSPQLLPFILLFFPFLLSLGPWVRVRLTLFRKACPFGAVRRALADGL